MKIASPRTLPRALMMATLTLCAAAGLTAPITSPAQAAARNIYVAKLAQPASAPAKTIIDGALWRCDGDTCSAPASGSRGVVACQRAATQLGEIAAFSTPKGELSAEELARCNES